MADYINDVFKKADEIFGMADELFTMTSTVGCCSCGGTVDFKKFQWAIKKWFEVGKFIVFKKTRKLYKCRKCGKYS